MDNRTLEEILEQVSPLHEPAIALLAMREAARVIRELKNGDRGEGRSVQEIFRAT